MNGKLKTALTLSLTLFGLWSLQAYAETNAFDGQTITNGQGGGATIDLGGGSGLANSIASPIINSYDPNSVNYTDQEAADNSRKNAAGTAGKSSGTGQAAHAAIGGTMIGIGSPMMASIDPIVRAAGIDLVTKGIIELAQSGADAATKDKNNAQRDLLAQNANQGGTQAKGNEIAKAVAGNAELNKLLSDKGINPEAFANSVQSGELQDPASITQALGGSPELSSEQAEQAAAMASSQMGQVFDEAVREKMGYDETNAVTDGTNTRGFSGGSGAESGLDKSGKGLALGEYIPSGNFAANHTAPGDGGNKNGPTAGAFDPKGFLGSIFGADGDMKSGADAAQKALELLGIRKPTKKGRMIFQEASYQYRGWGKWSRKWRIGMK